ncbi:uncharacterized protein VTP21DRAFT_7130 [Calcarisporiella thermophila]|uniref:uncharacterized protein n=1 Tax=Calcarisporiella thermophila TaxID=911321 RepID=UPI003743AC73
MGSWVRQLYKRQALPDAPHFRSTIVQRCLDFSMKGAIVLLPLALVATSTLALGATSASQFSVSSFPTDCPNCPSQPPPTCAEKMCIQITPPCPPECPSKCLLHNTDPCCPNRGVAYCPGSQPPGEGSMTIVSSASTAQPSSSSASVSKQTGTTVPTSAVPSASPTGSDSLSKSGSASATASNPKPSENAKSSAHAFEYGKMSVLAIIASLVSLF